MKHYVKWKPSLAVNVEKIDNQHKALYSRMNDVIIAVIDGQGKGQIADFTKFLAEYTRTHFGDEEALMKQHKYPEAGTHRAAHVQFTMDIDRMKIQVDSGEVTSELVVSVVTTLGEWLNQHISKMDKELGKYIRTLS
ncbi:bacteriohemerythrin [Thermodesulfobacteriota bacterium]